MNLKHLVVALVLAASGTAVAENYTGPGAQRVHVTTLKSFDFGRSYVHTPERHDLLRIAHLWRQRKGWTTLTLEGHGFVKNDEEASIALGIKRAERVRSLLVRWGVDPRFITVIGHSRAEPGRYVDIKVDTCDRCRQ